MTIIEIDFFVLREQDVITMITIFLILLSIQGMAFSQPPCVIDGNVKKCGGVFSGHGRIQFGQESVFCQTSYLWALANGHDCPKFNSVTCDVSTRGTDCFIPSLNRGKVVLGLESEENFPFVLRLQKVVCERDENDMIPIKTCFFHTKIDVPGGVYTVMLLCIPMIAAIYLITFFTVSDGLLLKFRELKNKIKNEVKLNEIDENLSRILKYCRIYSLVLLSICGWIVITQSDTVLGLAAAVWGSFCGIVFIPSTEYHRNKKRIFIKIEEEIIARWEPV